MSLISHSLPESAVVVRKELVGDRDILCGQEGTLLYLLVDRDEAYLFIVDLYYKGSYHIKFWINDHPANKSIVLPITLHHEH